MTLQDITVALEQAVAVGDLGAIANILTELKQLGLALDPEHHQTVEVPSGDVGVVTTQQLDHSDWPSHIRANIHDISKSDMQNILDVVERDYAHASGEERSRGLMEMIIKASRQVQTQPEPEEDKHKRFVIRRQAVVLDKEVWCTWVLECDDAIAKDYVEAILEETYDFPGDVYKDGDARYTSQEVKRSRNWNEVIEGVPLIRMEKGSNGYDLRLVDTPETTATKWADMPETAKSNRVEMPDANNQKTKLNVNSMESLRRILRRVVNGPDCLDALHEWESGYGHKVINGDTFEMHRHAAKAILEILERTSAE